MITDGTITNFNPSLLSLVQASLSGNLKQREDCLGLRYPDIRPQRMYGDDSETIYINSVCIRSVYQFMLKSSQHIVEIGKLSPILICYFGELGDWDLLYELVEI